MATAMSIATFQGFPGGININDPSFMIGDDQAVWIQDAWIYNHGKTIRRGPLTGVSGMVTFSTKIVGMVSTTDPNGSLQFGVLHTDGTTLKLGILASNLGSKTDLSIGTTVTTTPYPIIDAKPKLGGGIWIGVSQQNYVGPSYQFLLMWDGGLFANYSTGTITTTSGSTAVAGSGTAWSTSVSPGMYLLDSQNVYIGTVKSVNSNTSITLTAPARGARGSAAYTLTSLRTFIDNVVSGTLTVAAGSTAVTGGGTSFVDEGLTNNWNIFRYSDGVLLGVVSTITNNTALVLVSGATVAMQEDLYFATLNTGDNTYTTLDTTHKKPGFLNAVYAGRQWFANRGIQADVGGEWTDRLWFSEETAPEDMDMATVTGSYIPVVSSAGASTPIRAIAPAYNSLLVLKDRESFVLTGTDEDSFQINKIGDDGILSTMSAVTYGGGVIWAGRDSIYYYNGVNTIDLIGGTLGTGYKQAIKNFDHTTYRMWGAIVHDHYFLHIEHMLSPVPIIKNQTAHTPTELTFVIYMPGLTDKADPPVTVFTNLYFRGSVTMNTGAGLQGWFVVNDSSIGHVCDWDALFYTAGNDPFGCDGATAGPDFYLESKHHGLGSASKPGDLQKKSWKQLMMSYLSDGDGLVIDTVVGLNEIGQTASSILPETSPSWLLIGSEYNTWAILNGIYPTWTSIIEASFGAARVKFLKRSQYFAFRIYQNSASVTDVALGSYALGYKPLRPGRI